MEVHYMINLDTLWQDGLGFRTARNIVKNSLIRQSKTYINK